MKGVYAIPESLGEELEFEMLNETEYVRNPDGSVKAIEMLQETTSYATAHCNGDFEIVPY